MQEKILQIFFCVRFYKFYVALFSRFDNCLQIDTDMSVVVMFPSEGESSPAI